MASDPPRGCVAPKTRITAARSAAAASHASAAHRLLVLERQVAADRADHRDQLAERYLDTGEFGLGQLRPLERGEALALRRGECLLEQLARHRRRCVRDRHGLLALGVVRVRVPSVMTEAVRAPHRLDHPGRTSCAAGFVTASGLVWSSLPLHSSSGRSLPLTTSRAIVTGCLRVITSAPSSARRAAACAARSPTRRRSSRAATGGCA